MGSPRAGDWYGDVTNSPGSGPRRTVLKQERARETRRRLVDAAIALIRDQGFDQTRVSDICARAGVAESTFFFHFERKEDVLLELGLLASESLADEMAGEPGDEDPLVLLERFADRLSRRLERMPRDLVRHSVAEMYRHANDWQELRGDRSDFRAIFRRIYEGPGGGGMPTIGVDDLAQMQSAVTLHAVLAWSQDRATGRHLRELLIQRLRVVHTGAFAPAGDDAP